jgi:hypothetical protein
MLIPDIHPAPVCKRSQIGTALKRCRDAWQRAYDAVYADSSTPRRWQSPLFRASPGEPNPQKNRERPGRKLTF